jgi:HNH endonuclease
MANLWDPERPVKRTLGIRDKQILYERSHHRCENPACAKTLEFSEMQVGHKKAHSKGGGSTLKNSVALCWRCNKLQGTDSWPVFLKKQGITVPGDSLKQLLTKLTLSELKFLATKHGVKLKGRVVEGGLFSGDYRQAPSKNQYVRALSGIISETDVKSSLSEKLSSRLR